MLAVQSKSWPGTATLSIGSALGVVAFTWPLYLPESKIFLFQPDAARLLAVLVAVIGISIIAAEISRGALDSKAVAILGVLSALIAALRLIGAGAVGVEPMWFLLILASYVFGAKFGFSLGVLAMAASALLTGGIGPWLPFQMLAAGWIGVIAGSIGPILKFKRGKNLELIALVLIGLLSSIFFGLVMDLQLWPWLTGTDTQLSFIPGAEIASNLERFFWFHITTALSWDIPRAITTGVLIWLTGRPVLNSFRRAQLRLNLTSHEIQQKVAW
jgi:energy-coupling factor transport system substrate-specific component